jgi:hypothetical protein
MQAKDKFPGYAPQKSNSRIYKGEFIVLVTCCLSLSPTQQGFKAQRTNFEITGGMEWIVVKMQDSQITRLVFNYPLPLLSQMDTLRESGDLPHRTQVSHTQIPLGLPLLKIVLNLIKVHGIFL